MSDRDSICAHAEKLPVVNLLQKSTRGNSLYRRWNNMIARCHNPRNKSYANYGGRGISVCEEWRASFESYARSVGNPPTPQHQLDRIDNDGNYEPANVRWATRRENRLNSRSARHVIWNGRKYTLTELAIEVGMPFRTLQQRLDLGWTMERILEVGTNRGSNSLSQRMFSPEQVQRIRLEVASGMGLRAAARMHGCDLATMQSLIARKTYRDVL